MKTNEQNARINQLLRRYDEAKTTDAEEAELAEFFRTSTEVPEQWQDYAVLFSTLEAADTLFVDKERGTRHNRRGLWWSIGIAAAIIVVAGLFLWSNNTTEEVLPNRSKVNPPLPAYDSIEYVAGHIEPVAIHEVTNEMVEVKDATIAQNKGWDRQLRAKFFEQLTELMYTDRQVECIGEACEDGKGVYLPLIRDARITADNSTVDALIKEFLKAAVSADTFVSFEDSLRYMAFIYGGKVVQTRPYHSDYFDWELERKSVFDFLVSDTATSAWWAEMHVYPNTIYNTKAELHIHSVDKFYAKSGIEIQKDRQYVLETAGDTTGK